MKLKLKKKRNKFFAVKCTFDGIVFDSTTEAGRWAELRLLERAGAINCLQYKVVFVLAPKVKIEGESRSRPAIRYFADFAYQERGEPVVEDWKGPATRNLATFRLKQHLMKSVLGLDIRLTGS